MQFDPTYLNIDNLSQFTAIFIIFYTVLIMVYSFGFMRGRKNLFGYYFYTLLTAVVSLGAVFANHLVFFIVCWGFLGLLLYLLIGFGERKETGATAKKAFIIIGGTDAIMILGVAIVWKLAHTLQMDAMSLSVDNPLVLWAYLCLAVGALAKAGAMPFHTWVPDTAHDAPTSVAAYLPAALDKLLGIYFLYRMTLNIFSMNATLNTILMAIGSFTIIAAVMMALVQHDMKRLLGYHAVSQVGYMVLGLGTGNPIGIAGGLFHMLNNTIYKSCLFLGGGAVEKKTGTTDLDKLGGLFKAMPITFFTFVIAALAISGIPPFNGFFSKWMIYQGILATAKGGGGWWIVWLVAAMFGSALTLASFMKLVHTIFLGQASKERGETLQDMKLSAHIPTLVLALLCIAFGIYAYRIPLTLWIYPSIGVEPVFTGVWDAPVGTLLLMVAITIGLVIYMLGTIAKARTSDTFVGGEYISEHSAMRVSGTEFYNTVREIGPLKAIYFLAEHKLFDLYVVGTKITAGFTYALRYIHNGVLPSYLSWCLLGTLILFFIIIGTT